MRNGAGEPWAVTEILGYWRHQTLGTPAQKGYRHLVKPAKEEAMWVAMCESREEGLPKSV